MNIRSIAIAILSTSVLLLNGCFTGVESTPKITSKEVKKQNVVEVPEMHFLDSISPEPPAEWLPGKKFYITDPRAGAFFLPGHGETNLSKNDEIEYLTSAPANTFTGQDATDFTFKLPDGSERIFRVPLTTEELKEKRNIEIPFTIEGSIIDSLKQLMVGQDFYILTSLWYNGAEESVNGHKYVKVHVVDILPGNQFYPVRVVFKDDNSRSGSVFMSIRSESGTSRNFHKLFSFNDPHKFYPQISDENWQLIKNAKVTIGMTREECRLALGSPDNVSRRPSSIGLVEMWNYESGKYLVFADGILSSFSL